MPSGTQMDCAPKSTRYISLRLGVCDATRGNGFCPTDRVLFQDHPRPPPDLPLELIPNLTQPQINCEGLRRTTALLKKATSDLVMTIKYWEDLGHNSDTDLDKTMERKSNELTNQKKGLRSKRTPPQNPLNPKTSSVHRLTLLILRSPQICLTQTSSLVILLPQTNPTPTINPNLIQQAPIFDPNELHKTLYILKEIVNLYTSTSSVDSVFNQLSQAKAPRR
ncbi:hypothetical protein CEXT_203471 [Caerostris extrusa]|uniref:Uncharacterized protein n=1 Tax=Caerostris extrusa TaxID=172846 RepID=A0AAV4P6I3_CAEEX|nr:hypothetical protein CEXT_203471 [Caerostris extrusa]